MTDRVEEALARAGFDDPSSPGAEYRREIAKYLSDAGLPADDIVAILVAEEPGVEAAFRVLFPNPRMTKEEFSEQVGWSPDDLDRIRRTSGLPPSERASGAPLYSARDEPTFAALHIGAAMFGEDAIFRFVRVMGSATAQVAEAAVALFGTVIAQPLAAQHASEAVRFKAEIDATQSLGYAGASLDTLFRFHAETAIRRLNRAREGVESFESPRLVVGFIDLVGFTPLAANIDAAQLAALFDEFESIAFDVIVDRDGRVVKLIGDAIMFVALDADAACDIALTLVEQFRDTQNPVTPRGALALGEMLMRGGDYYGPVVNLAARAGDLAVPYEVLVSEELAAAVGPQFSFEPAGRRLLKGFAEPVALATLARASSRA